MSTSWLIDLMDAAERRQTVMFYRLLDSPYITKLNDPNTMKHVWTKAVTVHSSTRSPMCPHIVHKLIKLGADPLWPDEYRNPVSIPPCEQLRLEQQTESEAATPLKANDRLALAFKSKSASQGGLNLPDIRKLAKSLKLDSSGSRKEVLERINVKMKSCP